MKWAGGLKRQAHAAGRRRGGKSRGPSEEWREEGAGDRATRNNPRRHLCLFPLLQPPPPSPLSKRPQHMRQSQGSIQSFKVRSALL